jgi:GDPmannose 4,6-dehydratase
VVRVDPRYFRPTEVDLLLGDPTKAKHKLGWEPRVSIAELVKMMIASDMELAKRDKLLRDHHFAMGNHGHE